MPAHSDEFPWPSYYGNYSFFEARMKEHSNAEKIGRIDQGLYNVTRTGGTVIKAFVCECYWFGVAEYEETVKNLGKIDAIIINSNWCGYSDDVKLYCRDIEVGVFDIGSFMAALNMPKFWLYFDSYEKEKYKEQGII